MSSQNDESKRNGRDEAGEPEDGNRRRLVKALSVTGAVAGAVSLPERWTRPIVDSVSLPAHAQTTAQGFFGQGDLNAIVMQMPDSMRDAVQGIVGLQEQRGLLDTLVTEAHAGGSLPIEALEASSSSFAFATAFLSESNHLTLRFDLRLEEGENPLDIVCERRVIIPLCQEGDISLKKYKTLRLTNCDEFDDFDGFLQARIESIGPDSAVIRILFDGGVSDTLFLARGGNPPNCPDCIGRAEGAEDYCVPSEPEPES